MTASSDKGAAAGDDELADRTQPDGHAGQQLIQDLRDRAFADKSTIGRLQAQVDADHRQIDDLRAQALVDEQLIAELQSAGIADRDTIDQLKTALITSRRIGAAIGILMVTRQLTDERAVELLKQTSQISNRKMREVAEQVLLTGQLPKRWEPGTAPSEH